jgi:acyl carrier protein
MVPASLGLQDSDSLLDHQIVDSTGFLELIHFVESEFDIAVDEVEMVLENFESIDSIAQFVTQKRGATLTSAATA